MMASQAFGYGARVVNEGGGLSGGTLFRPAVLCPVNTDMRVYREEQFGPVVPIVPSRDIATPVTYIVESPFGQQLSISSDDPQEVAGLVDLGQPGLPGESQRPVPARTGHPPLAGRNKGLLAAITRDHSSKLPIHGLYHVTRVYRAQDMVRADFLHVLDGLGGVRARPETTEPGGCALAARN